MRQQKNKISPNKLSYTYINLPQITPQKWVFLSKKSQKNLTDTQIQTKTLKWTYDKSERVKSVIYPNNLAILALHLVCKANQTLHTCTCCAVCCFVVCPAAVYPLYGLCSMIRVCLLLLFFIYFCSFSTHSEVIAFKECITFKR